MGAEIDSLADAVNFGVAPALVIYVTLLPHSPVGWIFVLLYAVCVVLRLARFNALLDDDTRPAYTREFFTGMPAPCGAVGAIGPLAAMMQFGHGWWTSQWFVCALAGRQRGAVGQPGAHPGAEGDLGPAERRAHPADPGRRRRRRTAAVPVHPGAADHRRLPVHHPVHDPQPALGGGAARGVGRQTAATTRGPSGEPPGAAAPPVDGPAGPAQAWARE